MRKVVLMSFLIFLLVGCKALEPQNLVGETANNFKNGFENAGYKVVTEIKDIQGKKYLVENIEDTATTVQLVYLIGENEIVLVGTSEGGEVDMNNLGDFSQEIVLKAPLIKGNKWKSKGNSYEIIDSTKDSVTVRKVYPSGIVGIDKFSREKWKVERKVIFN